MDQNPTLPVYTTVLGTIRVLNEDGIKELKKVVSEAYHAAKNDGYDFGQYPAETRCKEIAIDMLAYSEEVMTVANIAEEEGIDCDLSELIAQFIAHLENGESLDEVPVAFYELPEGRGKEIVLDSIPANAMPSGNSRAKVALMGAGMAAAFLSPYGSGPVYTGADFSNQKPLSAERQKEDMARNEAHMARAEAKRARKAEKLRKIAERNQ